MMRLSVNFSAGTNNARVDVYMTSMFGRVDILLGSVFSASALNPSLQNVVEQNLTTPAFSGISDTVTVDICMPAGTYSIVFIASVAGGLNTIPLIINEFQKIGNNCSFQPDTTAGELTLTISLKIFVHLISLRVEWSNW